MKLKILTITLLLIVSISYATDTDDAFTQKLIGHWESEISSEDLFIDATEHYKTNGALISRWKVYFKGELKEEYYLISKWEVKDGYSYIEVTDTSNSEIMSVGRKFSDEIISVDDNKFIFESDNGKRTFMERIR